MKRIIACIMIVAAALTTPADASREYRIWNDGGGLIYEFHDKYRKLAFSGRQVQIMGYCASACTLVLKHIPRDRICVGPKAQLGFHSAAEPDMTDPEPNLYKKRKVYSLAGTNELWRSYPRDIQRWIQKNGGLTPDMIYLQGKELKEFFKPCRRT